jgi:hypothetical protein
LEIGRKPVGLEKSRPVLFVLRVLLRSCHAARSAFLAEHFVVQAGRSIFGPFAAMKLQLKRNDPERLT